MAVRILLLGANGMAGHMIHDYLMPTGKYELIGMTRDQYDFNTDRLDVFDSIYKTVLPDVIINCVGILNQKANNPKHQSETIYLNALLPHYLSEFPIKVIQLSTDCVFSGLNGPYDESASKDPRDAYGQSKSLGELDNKKDLTIRTSIIGPELKEGIGLFDWVLRQEETITGWAQSMWGGITTFELARVIDLAIDKNLTGLHQVTNSSPISKYHLLLLLQKHFNMDIPIARAEKPVNDRSLTSNSVLSAAVPGYDEMIGQLANYMDIDPYDRYKRYRTWEENL